MIKLIQNTLGDKKIIINGKNEMIKWEYIISKLYEKEKEEGQRAGTKLTSKHIYYGNHKMNVRLAAQVVSTSISDALLFTKTKDSSFDGCNATAEFCLMFNNAFDILNACKKLSNTPFNGAITEGDVKYMKHFMKNLKYMLLN
uniref:Transposable element P transposase-like GTP-binding insertion domain-containing protein n=1 Tax=Schizaphis graminum TaxID=13262 RepID=A0A2S2NG38_SCHGA